MWPSSRSARAGLLLAVLLPLALAYWGGALKNADEVNTDIDATDQSAYLNTARKMSQSGYEHVTDRNRMPIYPFLQSLIHRPDLSDQELFSRGKRLNVLLSLALLGVLLIVLRRYFTLLPSLNLVMIAAFTVFIFKAPYVQCELLYYSLLFGAYLLMCEMLRAPRWKLGLLTGAAAGLAHLTKAAVLPGLTIFLAVGSIKFLAGLARRRGSAEAAEAVGRLPAAQDLIGMLMVAASFLLVVYPYVSTSKRVFGRYFYNVNSSFYMWYDTHEEVMSGTRAHGDRTGWPRMPAEAIPSAAKYVREHSLRQMAARVTSGLVALHRTAAASYGYYKFLLAYAAFALFILIGSSRRALAMARDRLSLVVFAVCWFGAYALLYAWISATNSGVNRLELQQFLPAMFSLAGVAFSLAPARPVFTLGGRRVALVDAFNLVILAALAIEVPLVLASRLPVMYGGN